MEHGGPGAIPATPIDMGEQIAKGIGKLTPGLWARLMRALKWYKRNRRNLNALMREAKKRSGLPEQPAIIIASLQAKFVNAAHSTTSGVPAQDECEWLDDHEGECGTESGDVCSGPCVKYKDLFYGRRVPTNTCMYWWASSYWERLDASGQVGWYTTPDTVAFFNTWTWNDTAWYGGGTKDMGEPDDDTANHGDGWQEETGNWLANNTVGLPPAINVAVLGAVKNSEHEEPTGSPGWDHWWSFRNSSNCRFKQAPFNGVLPPAMKLGKYIDEDGEEQSTTWTEFNPIVIAPINYPPIVPLHIFEGDHGADHFPQNWSTETTSATRKTNMTYPFFCCTQLYTGGGCCC